MDSQPAPKRAKIEEEPKCLLHLFESGELYDCTFRASKSNESKDFKCHKEVLANASDVFRIMLRGNFKEASMDKDEPILMKNVAPNVFEFIMRYWYSNGEENDTSGFSLDTCILIYKFAHEMQIDSLTIQLDKLFKKTKASEIFGVFDLYQTINRRDYLGYCKEVLATGTAEALKSKYWLEMRSDSVQEFLQLKYLQAEEEDLVNALIDWANHKIPSGSPEKLRAELLPLLKFIRFSSMAHREFAQLCHGPLGKVVLTKKEKSSISASINTGELSLMPAELVPEIIVKRQKSYAVCRFPFTVLKKSGGDLSKMSFDFEINRSATLVGVNVKGGPLHVSDLWFTVIGKNQARHGRGKCGSSFMFGSERFCRITYKSYLDANTPYTLKFSSTDSRQLELPCYSLPNKLGSNYLTSDWLTVRVISKEVNVVLIESLMFEQRREKTST